MRDEPIDAFYSGFIEHNHFQIVEVQEAKKAILKVRLTEETRNPYGYAHGGLIFSLGDTAMGFIARSTGKKAVTQNCTINYLKPSSGLILTAEAEMIKNGKKICYLRCNFYNEQKELTATMEGNYFYVD